MKEKVCEVCKRVGKGTFCEYHAKAYYNIIEQYKYWKEAYEELTWEEYLTKLIENPENGKWVKELAKYLISKKMGRVVYDG